MKKIIFISLIIAHCALNITVLAQVRQDRSIIRGNVTSITVKYPGDITTDSLFLQVRTTSSFTSTIHIAKENTVAGGSDAEILATYAYPYTTVKVFFSSANTSGLTIANYYYDLRKSVSPDSAVLVYGTFKIQSYAGEVVNGLAGGGSSESSFKSWIGDTANVIRGELADYLLEADTMSLSNRIDAIDMIAADSTDVQGMINDTATVLRSEMASDSTNQRTFSDLKYPSKDLIQTWAETEALIAQQINDSLTTYYADIQALFDSITAIRAVVGYPAVPSPYDVLSPDVFYLAYGYDNYIFYDNLGIGVPYPPSVFFTPDSGDAYSNYYNFVPAASGEFSFTMGISSDTMQTLMRSLDSDIMITRGKLLAIGDSRTAGGQWVTELKTLVGDSLTLIGTLGTPPYYHEGISGWAYNTFCTNVSSPFVNNGHVDFDNYMTTNGFDTLNFVIIRLGTNDVFSANNSTITNTTTTALNYADSLIDAIHNYNTNTLIGICMETPPANDSTFLATYGGTQSYSQYKYNIHYFNKQLKAKYGTDGARELSYVSLIPLYLVADKDNDFANGVHENTTGYNKEAVTMLGWLWNQRLIYMDNIVVNGEFTTNIDDWSANNTPTTMEWSDGQMHIISDAPNDGVYQQIPIEAGKTYNLSFDINLISGTAIRTGVFLVSHQGYADYNILGTHTYSAEFTATQTGTAYLWSYATTDASEWYLDNVSVREKY